MDMKKPAAVSGRWFPFPLLLTRGRHPQRRSSWKNHAQQLFHRPGTLGTLGKTLIILQFSRQPLKALWIRHL